MICPTCKQKSVKCLETRHKPDLVYRRYVCACSQMFSTSETVTRLHAPPVKRKSRADMPTQNLEGAMMLWNTRISNDTHTQ